MTQSWLNNSAMLHVQNMYNKEKDLKLIIYEITNYFFLLSSCLKEQIKRTTQVPTQIILLIKSTEFN